MATVRVIAEGRGRPKTPKRDLIGDDQEHAIDIRKNLSGVTVAWLAAVFRMDHQTVRKRLGDCPEIGRGRGSVVLFDLAQAAGYLVKPKVNVQEWIKTLRPTDLPAYLQKDFWEAQNKRQQYEENAGMLWRTEKVIEVFADTFKLIKETMQLWADHIERNEGLTAEQRKIIMQLCDGLQKDLYKKLVEMKKHKQATNELADVANIEDEVNEKEKRRFSKNTRLRELI